VVNNVPPAHHHGGTPGVRGAHIFSPHPSPGTPFPVLKKIKENDKNFKKLNPSRCPCIMPSSFNENLKT
jgi:hypothetical protein